VSTVVDIATDKITEVIGSILHKEVEDPEVIQEPELSPQDLQEETVEEIIEEGGSKEEPESTKEAKQLSRKELKALKRKERN